MELFSEQEQSPLYFEELARRQGFRAVAGIDEAGRGPLAGPVVAAAVILPEEFDLPGLNDSKVIFSVTRLAVWNNIFVHLTRRINLPGGIRTFFFIGPVKTAQLLPYCYKSTKLCMIG